MDLFHTNIAYTLFQPKTSRQLVQEISRRVTEKNKLLELKAFLDKPPQQTLPKLKKDLKKKHKSRQQRKEIEHNTHSKSSKKFKSRNSKFSKDTTGATSPSKNFIFNAISRDKRSKLMDPEDVSPTKLLTCFRCLHPLDNTNLTMRFSTLRAKQILNSKSQSRYFLIFMIVHREPVKPNEILDKETANEFNQIKEMLKETMDNTDLESNPS